MTLKNSSLSFEVKTPTTSKEKNPGIFLLHGYGSDEQDLFSFASYLPEDAYVLSIRAPYRLQPFGNAWYAINFDAGQGKWNDTEQARNSRDMVKEFILQAIEKYNLDASRISLIGFSQGTILSYALALSYPGLIKNIVGLSGYIDPQMIEQTTEANYNELKVYASHGQVDMVIPPEWAQKTPGFLNDLNISCTYEEFPVGHGVSQENLQSFTRWLQANY